MKPFYFRHFLIYQDRCAMKIGMDSMVLGAFVDPGSAKRILDIGTGTGVLALMMAQKSKAMIDAVEADEMAAGQAEQNSKNSAWAHRIKVLHTRIQEYAAPENYDLIICNPPYFNPFSRKQHGSSEERKHARSHVMLDFESLLTNAKRLLAAEGRFYLILPKESEAYFLSLARSMEFYLIEKLSIRSYPGNPYIRVVLGLGLESEPKRERELTLYQSQGRYTDAYKKLTGAFHAVSFD